MLTSEQILSAAWAYSDLMTQSFYACTVEATRHESHCGFLGRRAIRTGVFDQHLTDWSR